MARYRNTELLASESIATAGTKVLDINVKDPISRLQIIAKLTNATTDPAGHPGEAIKMISVVDGSDVLFEMTGCEAAALGFFKTKMQPAFMMDYMNVEYCMFTADIYFGRYLWDRELALDPSQFNNLQILIQHDKALGGNTPTAGNMRVRADVFDEDPPSPVGFMLGKEVYQYTQVANTWYYVDLPTDHDISMIMMGCHNTTEGPEYNATSFKLTEDQDKHVIHEWDMEDYLLYISGFYPAWVETFYGEHDAGALQAFYITPTWERNGAAINATNSNGTVSWTLSAGQVLSIINETSGSFSAIVSGHNPFGMVPIAFGHQFDMNDYWKQSPGGSKRLAIKQAAGPDVSETYKVIVEQKRLY
jgi:hypothetical protein